MKTSNALRYSLFMLVFFLSLVNAYPQIQLGSDFSFHEAQSWSADGNRLALGQRVYAPDEFPPSYNHGVQVYEWTGTEWLTLGDQLSRFLYTDMDYNLALSGNGNHLAIGRSVYHDGSIFQTNPRVMQWDGDSWEQVGYYLPVEGTSLSLSADGTRLAIGFPLSSIYNYSNDGVAYVYEWNGSSWVQLGDSFEGTHLYENLGYVTLSVDGNRLAVHSPGYNYGLSLHGVLRLYEWDGDSWELMNTDNDWIAPADNVSFATNGNHLIATGFGQITRYSWDGECWKMSATIAGEEGVLSADGNRLLLDNGEMYQWSREQWTPVTPQLFPDGEEIDSEKQLSGNGKRIITKQGSSLKVYEADLRGFVYDLPIACADGGVQVFEGAVFPLGGEFSGPGIAAGSIPGSFTIDPLVAGIGTHTINYTVADEAFSTTITVEPPMSPIFSWVDTLVITATGLINIPGLGLPEGGIYTDDQGYITDDGNGLTFSLTYFDTTISTNMSYTVADENGCPITLTQAVVLVNASPNGGGVYPHQIGMDVGGEDSEGLFGQAISLSADGSRMAVGAPHSGLGKVKVYERTETGWMQMGETLGDRYWWGKFGQDVALSGDGNRLIVGIPRWKFADYYGQYTTGGIQMYEWDGSNWVTIGPDVYWALAQSWSYDAGDAVAISHDGTIIAIGRPGTNTTYRGEVILYQEVDGEWLRYDGGNLLGVSTGNHFGDAIALSADGTRLIVGQPDGFTGRAFVFDRIGGEWVEVGNTLSGTTPGDFGKAVAISADGQRVVVGEPQLDDLESSGVVRVYEWNDGTWIQMGTDLTSTFPRERLGNSVAISGNGQRVIVGAPGHNNSGNNAGRAIVYEWNGTNWEESESSTSWQGQTEDQFGNAVAISAYCDFIAVGAIQENALLPYGYVRTFALGQTGFLDNFAPLCIDAEPVSRTGNACPTGGIYSGTGVSDNGDGFSFTFDPSEAGVGQFTITYTVDSIELFNTIEVVDLPEVAVDLLDTLYVTSGAALEITGNGLPQGGVYSGDPDLFEDNGNGTTFNFIGQDDFEGLHTITYTYVDEGGCLNTATDTFVILLAVAVTNLQVLGVEVFPNPTQGLIQVRGNNISVIRLLDQQGKEVWKRKGEVSQIDISNLPAGVYQFLVQLHNGQWGRQQIVKN